MNDKELQCDIIDELDFDPQVDSTDVGVAVEQGVVTLSGHVATYAQMRDASRAVWRVTGVTAIVQKMLVHRPADGPTDEDLARRAISLLRWDSTVPSTIHVTVSDGWITLEGDVHAEHQRINAVRSLQRLEGLRGFHNLLCVIPAAPSASAQTSIRSALRRSSEVVSQVGVHVQDATVTLAGTVTSWAERAAARRTAWSPRGVANVVDRLAIGAKAQ